MDVSVTQPLNETTEPAGRNNDVCDIGPADFLHDPPFYGFIIVVAIVAIVGAIITSKAVKSEFYETLTKPSWAPPPAAISIIWIVLYLMIAYSTYRAYHFTVEKKTLIWIFMIQIVTNLLWIIVFFGLKNPNAARTVIVILLVTIVIQGVYMYGIDKKSAYIFLPYFLWTLFAAYLNFEIVRLNKL